MSGDRSISRVAAGSRVPDDYVLLATAFVADHRLSERERHLGGWLLGEADVDGRAEVEMDDITEALRTDSGEAYAILCKLEHLRYVVIDNWDSADDIYTLTIARTLGIPGGATL